MSRLIERFWFWFTWKLPHRMVYMCGVRMAANATCGKFGNKSPNEVGIMDMLGAWEKKEGGDKSFRMGDK